MALALSEDFSDSFTGSSAINTVECEVVVCSVSLVSCQHLRAFEMRLEAGLLVLLGCVLVAVCEESPAATAGKVCEPGKEVTKECGVCKCNAEGTEYVCPKECQEVNKAPEVASASEGKCTPGEVYKVGCNECKCPESGDKSQAACTIIGCPEK